MEALELAGLIWAAACGWAFSSYASNFIYRLPRGEHPFGRKPYCDSCHALLQPKDLFPIISYYMTNGKCRYCGSGIPLSYYIAELIFPLFFMAIYLRHGFGDYFLLIVFVLSALVVLVMMKINDGYFSAMTLCTIAISGLWAQTLYHHNITTGMIGAFCCLLLACGYYYFQDKASQNLDLYKLPQYVWLFAAVGCWLPLPYALIVNGLWCALSFLVKRFVKISQPENMQIVMFVAALSGGIFCFY